MLPHGFTYSFTQREAHAACGLGVAGYFLKYGFKVHAGVSQFAWDAPCPNKVQI